MKVLFLSDVPLANPTSGSEQVLYHQATGLARQGARVYAITRRNAPPPELLREVDGVREGSYEASPQKPMSSVRFLFRYPAKFYRRFTVNSPFRAVVCHQPFTCFSLLSAGKLRTLPMIYVFHSPSHEEYLLSREKDKPSKKFLPAAARRAVEGFCIRRAARVITLSRYMKDKAAMIHGTAPERITVNPGGVDLERFSPPGDRKALKEKLGLQKGRLHLLTVRNLEPRMGLDNLVRAADLLTKNGVDVHLVIGGEGRERKNLERLISECGLGARVHLPGFIPEDALAQYYGAADFFVLPTRSLEGFGLVTPESLACGTPVLGTPVGGTREILSGFDPGFLFRDPSAQAMADGIRAAKENHFTVDGKYEALRSRCRKYAQEKYSWERHVARLTSTLEGLNSPP